MKLLLLLSLTAGMWAHAAPPSTKNSVQERIAKMAKVAPHFKIKSGGTSPGNPGNPGQVIQPIRMGKTKLQISKLQVINNPDGSTSATVVDVCRRNSILRSMTLEI